MNKNLKKIKILQILTFFNFSYHIVYQIQHFEKKNIMETKINHFSGKTKNERKEYIKHVIKRYVHELAYERAWQINNRTRKKGYIDFIEIELCNWLNIYKNILIMEGVEELIYGLYRVQLE